MTSETDVVRLTPLAVAPPREDVLAARLAAALEAASTADAGMKSLIAALARLDPEGCLRLLVDEVETVRGVLPAAPLSEAMADAARGCRGAPARALISQAALRFGDLLTADAAATVFEALGADLETDESAALDRMLERFPAEPRLLRCAVAAARAADTAHLDGLLTRLGRADGSPGTVAFVRRMRPPETPASGRAVRIGLASSYTVDQLVPYVDLSCRALGLAPSIYVAPFNSWAREVLDAASGLREFAPEIVFLAISIDDLIPQLSGNVEAEALDAFGAVALERVVAVARSFAALESGAPLVVHSFHSAFSSPLGVVDSRERGARSAWLAQLNVKLAEALRALPATYVLDVAEASAQGGVGLTDNPKLRHLAGMRLPPQSLASIGDAYARYIAPLKGLTRKCVVLDLDGTLWGGVVGEDGKDGLRLGNTSPGSEFVEFQRYLQSLSGRGILLAVNSKNNEADALEVIRTHEAMLLREAAFSAIRINWKPKPENMIAIAEELNLGLDALVFVDDNPDERERMRQMLPQVLTVDLPRDPAAYRSVLARLPQLQTLAITDEDRARADFYQATRRRDRMKLSAASVDDYLRSLEIEVTIRPAEPSTLSRIAQLFARTNQFNTTTRRYELGELRAAIEDPAIRLWTLASKDRFGEHGLVALALVRAKEAAWTIDSFLMSCRVIGYGIETALLAHVSERARAEGAQAIFGEFVESKKNAPASDLFARHGFELEGTAGEVARWRYAGAGPIVFPAWIGRDAS